MSDPKTKPAIVTVGVTAPTPVQVILVAKYASDPSIPTSEVSTATFLKHAAKQQAVGKAQVPAKKVYVFEIETMGDIRKQIVKKVKSSEVIERIDILAHGNESRIGLKGTVTADNVTFDEVFGTFEKTTAFVTMSEWEFRGYAKTGKFTPEVVGWQEAVVSRLADDASINVYACNSGGIDNKDPHPANPATNTKEVPIIGDEGVLLTAIAKLFDRSAIGFAGYLLWLSAPTLGVNIFTFSLGVPTFNLPPRADGRVGQLAKNLDFYRDLNGVKRFGLPGIPLVIQRAP